MQFSKCLNCGHLTVGNITPSKGTSYVLTEVDTSKEVPNFLATTGLPVNVSACFDCKMVFLTCPSVQSPKA